MSRSILFSPSCFEVAPARAHLVERQVPVARSRREPLGHRGRRDAPPPRAGAGLHVPVRGGLRRLPRGTAAAGMPCSCSSCARRRPWACSSRDLSACSSRDRPWACAATRAARRRAVAARPPPGWRRRRVAQEAVLDARLAVGVRAGVRLGAAADALLDVVGPLGVGLGAAPRHGWRCVRTGGASWPGRREKFGVPLFWRRAVLLLPPPRTGAAATNVATREGAAATNVATPHAAEVSTRRGAARAPPPLRALGLGWARRRPTASAMALSLT